MDSFSRSSDLAVVVTLSLLDSINVAQDREQNKQNLDRIGGLDRLVFLINNQLRNSSTDENHTSFIETGLSAEQVLKSREIFGSNKFPANAMDSFLKLLYDALTDCTLLILIAAATVSLAIGIIENPSDGWEEATAIYIAVALCSLIAASNNYTKQLQFKALEDAVAQDEESSVIRYGAIERIHTQDIVVGDIIILQVRLYKYTKCISTTIIIKNDS